MAANGNANGNGNDDTSEAPRLAAEQAAALIEKGGVQVLDVRRDYEWDAGHVPGARHVEINELPAQAKQLGSDVPLLIYCHTGNRSGFAADALRPAGFDARVIDGGMVAWGEAGLPLEPEDGYVAESGRAAAELQARKQQKP